MFGNRKRKLEDDEESLVPHGLVWHATSEPTPEEAAKSEEVFGYTINYAQEIERARRQATEPVEQAQDPVSQAAPAKPAVIPWWRVPTPEPPVERPISKPTPMPLSAYVPTPIEPAVEPSPVSRIERMQIRPNPVVPVNPQPIAPPSAAVQSIQPMSATASETAPARILQASAPQVEGSLAKSMKVQPSQIPEPVIQKPPQPKPQVSERLVPKSSEISESLRLVVSRLQSAGKAAWIGSREFSGRAIEQGRQTLGSLQLGERTSRAGKQGQQLMQSGMAKTNSYARATGAALGSFSRAGVSRVQQISARVRAASATTTGDVVRPATTSSATPSRVRVLLAASALQARVITAQRFAAWRMRRERMAIDSRFWSSMTMAAIAAIIALVIVSVVPHYAAKSLPSQLLNTNPSVDANVAAPVAATPTAAHIAAAPARKGTTVVTHPTGPKTGPAKASAAKASANPKPKHVVRDDYVAPNTYKYYGTGSKSSR